MLHPLLGEEYANYGELSMDDLQQKISELNHRIAIAPNQQVVNQLYMILEDLQSLYNMKMQKDMERVAKEQAERMARSKKHKF